ncbi:ABC transporter substrate-binding protein [Mycobacterium sp. CBMA293]|uniref:ABC transporter substrate-binding protein n=2 Tax=Mycolicibacterium TaxID=1866885 RepID=UPI00132553E1|nr:MULTISPECIES: ABC transporter substrate-binding protein [unclassified Mycolicibacterium]MUL47250.1 ABC transporter substrate-binding protein [Mycolicibacterium sp. CBMA 360]MUL96263.1 ABC transporter substrate-binding protein [Mycolicibacterium sp. CBMA 230]MUL61361.1 ABC transporter substrate-binding protein [Mycolicibacterium sp. CBMA 335]MUL72096.1 ABC transporter substrate-binding protein [Mycolicibacterium sp. CBMA 311]MUM08913.1 ABC transporter substrate-binding protein [Mycolicibacte
MKHSRALRLLSVLAAGALLTACVSGRDTKSELAVPPSVPLSDLAGVTLQVGDQKGGTESLLRAAGELDNVPYRVQFSTFTSGPPQVEAATAGKIDFAVTGNTPPIFGAAAGAKIRVVSAYSNEAGGDQILVPADSAIHSVADLRGKKVLAGKGSSAHGHLLLQLQKANLAVKDIQLVFLQPADAFTALSQGQADAWAIWDPYTALAQKQLKVRTLVTAESVSNGYGFGIASVAALQDAKRNAALADFVQRVARASVWAKAHPQQWYEKYAAAIGIDPAVAQVAQSRSLRLAIPIADEVVASEQQLADAFAQSGQIDHKPTFSHFVDNRFGDVLSPFWNTAK